MKPVSASAPGKVILFGEHAVVHGQPAVAVPLNAVQVTVRAVPGRPGSGVIIKAPDAHCTLHLTSLDQPPDTHSLENALVYPVWLALDALKTPLPDLTLTIHSTIPVASGLGSGAALAAALIRAVVGALDHPLSKEALNALVFEVEKRHHGTPSGIDNTVIVYEQPVYFVRDNPIETFSIARPFTLLVANSGKNSPTRIPVGEVRQLYESDPELYGQIFACIGDIVRRARTAIEHGDIESLGPLMNENHSLLRELTVSSDELDRLCDAARQAGAGGAKLSGAGRGGNIIAITRPDQAAVITEALRQAGAVSVIETAVG